MISETGENTWATTYEFTDNNTTFAPVSTIGSNDGSAFNFFKQKNWKSETSGSTTVYNVNEVQALTDAEKSSGATPLYWSKTFDIKASQPCTLYLDNSTQFTTAAASGITNTMNKSLRLALVVKDNTNAVKSTYVYQLDATADTNTYNTTLISAACDGITKSVKGVDTNGVTPVGEAIKTLTLGDTAGTYTTLKQIGATGANYALAEKPAENTMITNKNNADELYKFTSANEICKVTAYIWMEGCDYDCNSSVVQQITGSDNKVTAVLGFSAAEND